MRFRASIENVPVFSRIIQAVEKLQKKCIIRFNEKEMHIICNSDGGVQVWSQIKVDSLFTDYRIQSNAENHINVELAPSALLQALRSALDSPEVVMKLAKKDGHACLSFDIVTQSRTHKRVLVSHDVRISVLRPDDIAKLKEPLCPEPDIHILLPPLQKLRTVVDHLRQMSDVMAIQANHLGDLRLSVETDAVKVDTQWTKCTIPNMAQDSSQDEDHEEPDPAQMFAVMVSIRDFTKFLSSHVVSTTTIACVCQNHCMILYVYIGDVADAGGVLTFYIPARLSGLD